jgi:hypothetical protein
MLQSVLLMQEEIGVTVAGKQKARLPALKGPSPASVM